MKLSQVYDHAATGLSRVTGYQPTNEEECRTYLKARVRERLSTASSATFLRDYLKEMADTGFSITNLKGEVEVPRTPRDWEVGEALAEALLEDHFDCLFPWPTSWDRREVEGNPTGPDLPGYHTGPDSTLRFAFGEVKSSSQKHSPPLVIRGIVDPIAPSTLVGQLRRLLSERERRQTLIAWLGLRERHAPETKARFTEVVTRYYGTRSRCLVVGCLISGAREDYEKDYTEAIDLLKDYAKDHDVWLLAFYIPFHMDVWPSLVAELAA